MSLIRGRDTGPEKVVRSTVHRLGYRFRLYRRDLPGTPDLVFPGRKSAIFVHGCFWHGHACSIGHIPHSNSAFWRRKILNTKQRDSVARRRLQRQGWRVLSVWECELAKMPLVAERITRFLEDPKRRGAITKRGNDGRR